MMERLKARQDKAGDLAHPDANLLSAFAENKLNRRERNLIVSHLADCPACRELLAVAARAQEPEAAEWAMDRATRRRGIPLAWRVAAGIAVACCVVAIAFQMHLGLPPRASTPVALSPAKTQIPAPPLPSATVQPSQPATSPPIARKIRKSHRAVASANSPEVANKAVVPTKPEIAKPDVMLQVEAAPVQKAGAVVSDRLVPTAPPPPSRAIFARPLREQAFAKRAPVANRAGLWLAGPEGTLLHSSDNGVHWEHVKVVEGVATLSGAVTGIDTRQFPQITVTTDSGAQWTSLDGGRHWRQTR